MWQEYNVGGVGPGGLGLEADGFLFGIRGVGQWFSWHSANQNVSSLTFILQKCSAAAVIQRQSEMLRK